jgi:predicted enzyme related to lactoylglutathione lyase
MTSGLRTIIIPVDDLAAAKAVYGALLRVGPSVDESYYVGFDAGGQHLGLDPGTRHKGLGPVAYWHVDDLTDRLQRLVAAGAEVEQDASDVGGGTRVAVVRDADGNVFGLRQDTPQA